jgi:RNA polymerase subunit RPABC4/transcription elongation factor Spt4
MLDLKRCPVCYKNTSHSATTCPYCGHEFNEPEEKAASAPAGAVQRRCKNCNSPITGNRKKCPVCKAPVEEYRGMPTYLVIAGFIVAAVLLAVFVFHIPGEPPKLPSSLPGSGLTPSPTVPLCNIAITGQKTPTSAIQLRLAASGCGPQDVTDLRVFVNDKTEGTLPYRLSASGTYPGHKGSDHVIVVANFSSGYEKVIFDATYA